jgi:hypothetical protein
MKTSRFMGLTAAGIVLAASANLLAEAGGKPRTFLVKLEHLALSKQLWQAGDRQVTRSMDELLRKARAALKKGPYSVTQKKYSYPGADPHDFLSYGIYYWPNPKTKDGIPWVIRDGHRNPDAVLDWRQIRAMSDCVEVLALAYYFTGSEAYAAHAALLLRTWFIDKATRMNPNVNYGKVVPGVREGGYSAAGMAYRLRKIYDAAGILESSPAWREADKKALQQWSGDFIRWTETSPYGKEERTTRNNHSTFFHMTVVMQALYIGDMDKARKTLKNYMGKMFPIQFAPDGSQPIEMKRANNYDYHRANLLAALDIAQLTDHFNGIDLWNYQTPKGASLRKSIEFLIPYFTGKKKWPYFKKETFTIPDFARWRLLRRAALGFADPRFEKAARAITGDFHLSIIQLTYPEAALKNKTKQRMKTQ